MIMSEQGYQFKKLSSGIITLCFCYISSVNAATNNTTDIMSLAQLTKDVDYLASDELKGRSNLRPEINTAANYIAKRFNEIGLRPFNQKVDVTTLTKNISINDYFQHFNYKKSDRTYPLKNVIAHLPGNNMLKNGESNDVIIFSAHYDHLGMKEPISQQKHLSYTDNIYNGANDNAASVAALFQLANYFKLRYKSNNKGSNKRTVLFVAFAGEELGILGSKHFAKTLASLAIKPENISAMINIEMIGKDSKFGAGQAWMTGPDKSNLLALMNNSIKKQTGEPSFFKDPYPKAKLFYRSDNISLAVLGVPAHTISSSQIDSDTDYHQVSDNINSLNLNGTYQVIQNIAKASHELIMATATPNRIKLAK